MKKILVFLFAMFIGNLTLAYNINWHTENEMLQITSCEIGDDVTPPTPPSKRGYRFKEWQASDNLFDITALQGRNNITIIDGDTFSVIGYPCPGGSLKTLAPGVEVGDTITITASSTTSGNNFVYVAGLGGTVIFSNPFVVTDKVLNGTIQFYGFNGNQTPATIKNLKILKVE